MEIQSGIDGLKTLLGGVTLPPPGAAEAVKIESGAGKAEAAEMGGDRATLSAMATEVSMTASEPDLRMDKVAGVQAALAAGTYDVPASAVATKVIEAMLGGGR